MKFYNAVALLILAAVICFSTPALGADKYLGGTPEITAYLTGVNEFSPGQDATITVVIQNSGTNAAVFIDQSTLTRDDLPTTAKLVTAGLSSGGAPINITTDPQNLGDIPSPGMTTASFTAKITSDATLGEYTLPLTVQYQLPREQPCQPADKSDYPGPVHPGDRDDPAHDQDKTGRPD